MHAPSFLGRLDFPQLKSLQHGVGHASPEHADII